MLLPIDRKKHPSILTLIETVQRLKDAYRPLTRDERELIARWPGWGPSAPAFEVHPNKEKGEHVYGEIKHLLVQKGVPIQGIRFIHEVSESDTAKAVLFEKCRTGEVAILLGSTAKLGTGTNIQTRRAAIHHCDAPWRPDEVEQREGRGQRPGNLYPVVEVFYYVQRRTFDAYSWQILSNKAKFFNQMRNSTVVGREMASSKGVAQEPGLTLWDVLVQESQPEVRVAVLTTVREPQQLTLL